MKEHKYDGETFLLDDSKGCYIEVNFAEHLNSGIVGYVGVNPQGTKANPYTYGIGTRYLTENGLVRDYGGPFASVSNALNDACRLMLYQYREQESKKEFDPEQACKDLHEFFEELPD